MNRRHVLALVGSLPAGALAAEDKVVRGPDSGALYPTIAQLAGRGEYPHSFLTGRYATVDAWRAAARDIVLAAFSYRPKPVEPRAEVVVRVDLGDIIREKVLFSTAPEFRVPAFVHIPKGLKGRAPAIVDLHSHGGMFLFGKEKVADLGTSDPLLVEYHKVNYGGRPTATALARRGYVVITIDALGFGERRIAPTNRECREKESTLVKSLTYAGMTWPGIVTWDDMRTVDYLVTRPEVDPSRIGCVGVSFGGWRSLFLAGLDDRIAAGCVVGFMSTVRPMIRRHIDTHSFVHFVPSLHAALDLPDVVALRVPKPLLVLQCRRDELFPLEGMEQAVAKIAAIYAKAGAGAQFSSRFYDVPHEFNVPMQEDAFAWFDKLLKA
ncbi:MAG: dienelactone hydrolase family protein [Acidobacteriota bacterium]